MTDEQILGVITDPARREEGFRLLMVAYQERLYGHVRRMVTGHDDANDVLQNCFIKVFSHIDRFRGQSQLYTWLYRIATNEALSFLEKRGRRNGPIDAEDQSIYQLRADPYFEGDEVQRHLILAINRLPARQRAVFNLRYFDEMSYREMAEVLGVSVGGLKANYHHAVKKIAQYFKDNEWITTHG
jgi:RNA polymerase sigma-70 factor, ECF subfamily